MTKIDDVVKENIQMFAKALKIELPDDDGKTPLHIACEYGKPKIVRKLLKKKYYESITLIAK